MKIPKSIQNLVESFERLPGIGPKSAERLTFYLLHVPQEELDKFAESLKTLKTGTIICSVCMGIGESDPCEICSNPARDHSIVCVVEEPLDVIAIEKGKKYTGLYQVLHGRIDPLNNIGPDEIFMDKLFERIKNSKNGSTIKEVILATNPTMEGEATAMYIARKLKSDENNLKITRIGRGLPVGSDIEYADEITLENALMGRQEY